MAKSEREFIYRPDRDGSIAQFFARKARSAFRAGYQETYSDLLSAAAWNCFSAVNTKHGVAYVFEDKSWLWVEKGTWSISETTVPPFADTQKCGGGRGCVCALCDEEWYEKRLERESASDQPRGSRVGHRDQPAGSGEGDPTFHRLDFV